MLMENRILDMLENDIECCKELLKRDSHSEALKAELNTLCRVVNDVEALINGNDKY